ncbi:hypothetical protein [Nitratireductor sp. GCM10026969]|uniref:hypothetical protein n=1 Tax=Nitratireductor sp. GCM10026969 TaxID=3252645 RepID=UPI00361A26DA
MADHPILFSGPMVRALLDGRKTQTRRVIKPAYEIGGGWPMFPSYLNGKRIGESSNPDFDDLSEFNGGSPLYGGATPICPGDRLWVREKGWERPERTPQMMRDGADTWDPFYYDADDLACFEHEQFNAWGFKRRPSIHMPRWASRLTLLVTDVRVQRVQQISEEDAIAEGVERDRIFKGEPAWRSYENWVGCCAGPVSSFATLWDSLNEDRGFGWDENPWVVALTFRVIKQNIDQIEREAA